MLKILLITILLLTNYTTTVQAKHNASNKEAIMELFNIKLFNKNKDSSNNEWNFTLTDGTEIKRSKDADDEGVYYIEQRKPFNSPYTYYYIYNEQGILIEISTQFHDMYINKRESYNNRGEVINTENYNEPYPFSIDDLKKKLQDEYTVNIMDTNQIDYITRYTDHYKEMPIYDMGYHHKETPRTIYCLIIDATTGKTLFETSRFTGRRSGLTPYDEYIQSLQETKPAESDIEQE